MEEIVNFRHIGILIDPLEQQLRIGKLLYLGVLLLLVIERQILIDKLLALGVVVG